MTKKDLGICKHIICPLYIRMLPFQLINIQIIFFDPIDFLYNIAKSIYPPGDIPFLVEP